MPSPPLSGPPGVTFASSRGCSPRSPASSTSTGWTSSPRTWWRPPAGRSSSARHRWPPRRYRHKAIKDSRHLPIKFTHNLWSVVAYITFITCIALLALGKERSRISQDVNHHDKWRGSHQVVGGLGGA